jgi:hypothetical protein
MTKQLPTVMVCSECQKLLEASTRAREAWRKPRAEISWSQLVPEETVDELLRLQAKYARAYTTLQQHVNNCGRCEPLSKIA